MGQCSPFGLTSTCVLFADDVLIYQPIKYIYGVTVLQQDLDKLYNWCTDNGMTFNAAKSKVMHVTRKRNLQLPGYMLGHCQLSITS